MTDEETRAMTLRLPAELHEWLRREAFERRVAMNALVVTAIERDRDERAKGAAA